jgi:hypothetical protein
MTAMKKGDKDHGQYVRKVQEETLRHSKDLLAENERLRTRVVSLEGEVAALELERPRLVGELDRVREDLRRHQALQQELKQKLELSQAEGLRYSESYLGIERQNANLANLYVASYRLHGTLDREELYLAIQEILSNLIGCEEAGLFEVAAEAAKLKLIASFGIEREPWLELPLGEGIIGQSAVTGEIFIGPSGAARSPREEHLTVSLPVTLDGRVIAVIALFRLLSHKGELTEIDRELLDLLANQAGTALYCTKLHAERPGAPAGSAA